MANKVSFGLTNVYYSKLTTSEGVDTYGSPTRLYGAQEFSSEVIGGSERIYADDSVIATLSQNAGRNITLKLTELDNEFKTAILGYVALANGNLVEVTNTKTSKFALGFEFQGDVEARRVWFYKCSVTPINESTKTKGESAEANSISLSIVAEPISVGNFLVTHVVAHKSDDNYATFLTVKPELPAIVG
jgi:phi13 family phage major tail protein